ncbi:MAG: efflux RND transporter periplasmic adaptor subunit [Candidatus Hydrogenedentota bacterium]|nr:MAG: efflux RND transporter periplasmic adaptor subunit [Candidatus Hydrogenedentota bacterium]
MKRLILFIPVLLLTFSECKKQSNTQKVDGYYTCSMHPQVIKHEPGNCPICGMKLVFQPTGKKKKKHEGHDMSKMDGEKTKKGFTFSVAEELLVNAKLLTVPAEYQVFSKTGKYSAHIDYNEDNNRLVIITTKYDGWVEKLFVSKEGQKVKRGQLLMGIYSPKILAAMEEYLTTYQSLKEAYASQGKTESEILTDPTVLSARNKLKYLDVPEAEIRKLEKTGKVSRRTWYTSPITGVVVKKNVLEGQFIKAGQEIMRIANLSKLWVFIHIFEKDLPFVKTGQKVILKTAAYPDKKFIGRIDLIYPYLNPETRDLKVRIVVPNAGNLLKPGMFGEVHVKSTLPGKRIIIPDSAVIYSGEKSYVFVSTGDGEFELRDVEVQLISHGKAVISKGLKENELVVVNGQFLLDSEASLKEAVSKGGMVGHHH